MLMSKLLYNIWGCLVEGFASLKGVDGIKVPQSRSCSILIMHRTTFYLHITDVATGLPMSITKSVKEILGDFGVDSRKCYPNELDINMNFWFLPLFIYFINCELFDPVMEKLLELVLIEMVFVQLGIGERWTISFMLHLRFVWIFYFARGFFIIFP